MEFFDSPRWLNTVDDEEMYQTFCAFLEQNYDYKMGIKFCKKCWLFMPINEVAKHYKQFSDHHLVEYKSMAPLLRVAKQVGALKEKEESQDVLIPGMKFEGNSPLFDDTQDNETSKTKSVGKACFKSMKTLLKPGMNMILIKQYNDKLKKFEATIRTSGSLNREIIKTTSQLEKCYFHLRDKRRRDLQLIRDTIELCCTIIEDSFGKKI